MAWAAALPADDLDRLRFHHHPELDLVAAFAPWYEAGLPDPARMPVRDFASFHRRSGWDLDMQVYRDAARPSR